MFSVDRIKNHQRDALELAPALKATPSFSGFSEEVIAKGLALNMCLMDEIDNANGEPSEVNCAAYRAVLGIKFHEAVEVGEVMTLVACVLRTARGDVL